MLRLSSFEYLKVPKYLGQDLTADLKFNTYIHVSRITSNTKRSLGFIIRNVITKNEKIKELVYKSQVRPYPLSGVSILNPALTK